MDKAKKNYILDTNVFIYEPNCLFMFEEHDIYIAPVTLRELTRLKNKEGEVGYSARRVKKILDQLRGNGKTLENGLPLGKTLGRLHIIPEVDFTDFRPGMSKTENDDLILAAAAWKTKSSKDTQTILVTDDMDMSFLADLIHVKTEHFRHYRVTDTERQYTGRREILITNEQLSDFYKLGFLTDIEAGEQPLQVNEFVLMKNEICPSQSALGRFDGEKIVPLKYLKEKSLDFHPFGVIPRNVGQRFMQEALLSSTEEAPLVIIKGAAGTAKTFLTLACGLESVLEQGLYKRILITRANVEMDQTYGFLPGTEEEKIAPMMRPFWDNLEALCVNEHVRKDDCNCPNMMEYLLEEGIIKPEAMQYMRGRSIKDTYVIIDEAQNCTPNQIFSIISRIGEGSKIILLGDPDQIDNKYLNKHNNGLVYAAQKFKGSSLCYQLELEKNECVRSRLAKEASRKMANEEL